MPRQKIVLRRRVTPQRVRLPNGQSFLVRYKRASRRNLHQNMTVRRTRRIGPRKKTQSTKRWKSFSDNSEARDKSTAEPLQVYLRKD